jgi:hypothetical protein
VTTPPEPPAPPDGGGLGERVTQLEAGQHSISDRLDQVLGFLQSTPDAPAEPAEPERPELGIADEISRQLDARDRRNASRPRPAAPAKAPPADLAEQAPVAPVRRLTKIMWGEG